MDNILKAINSIIESISSFIQSIFTPKLTKESSTTPDSALPESGGNSKADKGELDRDNEIISAKSRSNSYSQIAAKGITATDDSKIIGHDLEGGIITADDYDSDPSTFDLPSSPSHSSVSLINPDVSEDEELEELEEIDLGPSSPR